MDDVAQAIVSVLVIALVVLLVVRLALAIPERVRRIRRPEWRTIRVVGVGGGGSNAVDRMVEARVRGVQFVACNTDAQALRRARASKLLRIGDAVTRGLGSGGDPDVGRRSAEEDVDRIGSALAGADLVFLAVGLGGGTGSGAAPIIAAKAREQGALTIAVATRPFGFEGAKRQRIADQAAQELTSEVDALILIPNDRAGRGLPADVSLAEAFRHVDGILLEIVQAIIDLLRSPGLVNVDFADLRSIMHDAGPALVGIGRAAGQGRAELAAHEATTSELLEADVGGARRILFAVAGSSSLRLDELTRAADGIRAAADPEADIIFGATLREELGDEVQVTLIATDLNGRRAAEAAEAAVEVAVETAQTRGERRRRRPPADRVSEESSAAQAPVETPSVAPTPGEARDAPATAVRRRRGGPGSSAAAGSPIAATPSEGARRRRGRPGPDGKTAVPAGAPAPDAVPELAQGPAVADAPAPSVLIGSASVPAGPPTPRGGRRRGGARPGGSAMAGAEGTSVDPS